MQAQAAHPLELRGVAKSFVMHLRGGTELRVVENVSFVVPRGTCVALDGPSGIGKSSILRMVYGNYLCDRGEICVEGPRGVVDVARAEPREVLRLRQTTLGYVSQFLSVIPRISARDIVAASAREGAAPLVDRQQAIERAESLLSRLNVPERLWSLPPATFSGGEKQRVNIARGFAPLRPILLLDEPTASLDTANRDVVVELLAERKAEGCAILGIFHDHDVREAVADQTIDVAAFACNGKSRVSATPVA